ncbi:MAG: asparagine synthase (glutamine-hydrolyzing) [Acidimicrobiales bacterium]
MCGIAGLLGAVTAETRSAVERMSDALVHRGPDGEGMWESDLDDRGHGCIMAHRRLSILDLSSAADQPMTDVGGGHTIVFNGEIYNFRELRAELTARGERFTSSGDTEVMLRWLAAHGPDRCDRLRGMFAFAVWDHRRRRLTLARDPHGIKPLYVCRNPDPNGDWTLVFASEVRAILAAGLLDRPRLAPEAVASVVWNGFVAGPLTAVEGIERHDPGVVSVIDAAGATVTSTFARMGADGGDGTTIEGLARELQQSVDVHLEADVPLGVFLSSGIDSSVVANLARRARPDDRIDTFTLAFEDQSLNEADPARAIAEAIGTEHHEILLTESDFVADLDTALDTLDQPTFDGLNTYFMSRSVRQAGLTVALAGTGGDELFGGYQTFAKLPAFARWSRATRAVPEPARRSVARRVSQLAQRGKAGDVAPQTRWAKLPEMVAAGGDLLALYQLSYALFLPEMQSELLTEGLDPLPNGLPSALQDRLREETRGATALASLSVFEQRCFLGERLLPDSDAASMAVSLELRVPLVDHTLSAHVARMDDDRRYRPVGRKQALRDAGLVGIPPALFERPKQGFQLPFDLWIRRNLGSSMDDTMRDRSSAEMVGLDGAAVRRLWDAYRSGAPGLFWSRVWAIYVLIRWCDRNGVAR